MKKFGLFLIFSVLLGLAGVSQESIYYRQIAIDSGAPADSIIDSTGYTSYVTAISGWSSLVHPYLSLYSGTTRLTELQPYQQARISVDALDAGGNIISTDEYGASVYLMSEVPDGSIPPFTYYYTVYLNLPESFTPVPASSYQVDAFKTVTYGTGAPESSTHININGIASWIKVYMSGSPTLSADWDFEASAPPTNETIIRIYYTGDPNCTINGKDISFFGTDLTDTQIKDTLLIYGFYVNSEWKAVILQDISVGNWVGPSYIDYEAVLDLSTIDTTAGGKVQLADSAVTTGKMAAIDSAKIIIGSSSGNISALMSGDITMDESGATTVGGNKIDSTNISPGTVALSDMQDVARGSLIVGNSSNRPQEIDASTNGGILIGDGSDVSVQTVSGEATMDATGAITIANNVIDSNNISAGTIALSDIQDITTGYTIVGDGSNRPKMVEVGGDATMSSAGVITISDGVIESDNITLSSVDGARKKGIVSTMILESGNLPGLLDGTVNNLFDVDSNLVILDVQIHITTTAGTSGVIDIGVDGDARASGADGDGFVVDADANQAGVYSAPLSTYSTGSVSGYTSYTGALLKGGYFFISDTGHITIQSSVDLSGSSVAGSVIIKYLNY